MIHPLLAQLTAADMGIEYNLDMILMGIQFKLGWGIGLAAWSFVLQFTFGLLNNTIKELVEKRIVPSAKADAIFGSVWYRLISHLMDKLARVKLPKQAKKVEQPAPTP